jgi:hypothetical protein
MECPECGATKIHKSHRRGTTERTVLVLFAVHPYRCSECRARFYRKRGAMAGEWVKVLMNPPAPLRIVIWAVVLVGAVASVVGAVAMVSMLHR